MTKLEYCLKELTKDILKNSKGFFETIENLSYTDKNKLSLEKSENILYLINKQNSHIFVALKNLNEIIGTATILIENKFIHGGSKVAHIEDVSTKKEYEGKGIGSNLIKKCINFAKKEECYKIILNCKKENNLFYKKLGFYECENQMRKDISNYNLKK